MKPRVKICCIQNIKEAKEAIQFGASALGLVAKMPSGPGVISDEKILEISRIVPPPVATFLLTSETSALEIIRHQEKVRTNTIQMVDRLKAGTHQTIRESLSSIKLVQVIHVVNQDSIAEAEKVAPFVDALLLDSGNPDLKVKELGGTGKLHDWEISREINIRVGMPVFLAGGLNPNNIQKAIDIVEPFGVDLFKLERFMKNIGC